MSQAVINDNERDIVIGTLHSDLTSFNQSINIIISVASDKALSFSYIAKEFKTFEKGALDAEEQIQKAHVTKISYTRLFQSDKPITKGQAAIALATGDVLEMLLKYSICRP
ncbi:hypothetical protein JHK84_043187 [Glycine max]|nr:hypothetical protein JHK84_043187 [Glycine max]